MQLLRRGWEWLRTRPLWLLVLLNLAAIGLFQLSQSIGPQPSANELQTCFYAAPFSRIVESWSASGLRTFIVTLVVLDSLFPLLYAAGLRRAYELWCRLLGFEPLAAVSALPLVAACFDLVENLFLLLSIRAWSQHAASLGWLVHLVAVASLLKWALLFIVVLALIVALFQSPWGWAFSTARYSWISVLLGGLPLIVAAQGQDLLRILADNATGWLQWWIAGIALVGWATSVWYWSRVLLMIRRPEDFGEDDARAKAIVKWLPRALGTAAITEVALGFLRTAGATVIQSRALAWHAFGAAALAAAFLLAVSWRRTLLRFLGLPPTPPRVGHWSELPTATRTIAVVSAAASLLALLLVTGWAVPIGRTLGAPAIVFGFAAHIAFAGSLLLFFERLWSLRFVPLALVCAVFFSRFNDNHALRLVNGGDQSLRPPLAKEFDAWAADRLSRWQRPEPMPVFLVAAEGGGIRAAYWTAAVLARLADSHDAFADHVFAISGVSGGSVGAATFVSLLRDKEHRAACAVYAERRGHGRATEGSVERCAQEILRQDHLSPVLAKMLVPDLAQWFVPFPVPPFDRARALEDSFSDAYRHVVDDSSAFEDPFSSGWPRCATSDCTPVPVFAVPALLLNGTRVKDGRRLLHAPVTWTEQELPGVTDLAVLLRDDVSLSTAAHNSARFAYVSPAGRLLSKDGIDQGHVVDGGYFENSGAATAFDVLDVLRNTPSAGRVRFEVLYLCNSADRCWEAETPSPPVTTQHNGVYAGDALAPVQALLGARESRGEQALTAISRLPKIAGFLEFGTCMGNAIEAAAPEPLGWQLSEQMRSRLSAQVSGTGAPGNATAAGCVGALIDSGWLPVDCQQRIPRRVACGE